MEHLIDINMLSEKTGIKDNNKLSQLIAYANNIQSENMKYNLTGHKTLTDIIENLIVGSLEPTKNIDVPRGTLFADIGTGAGIPGLPLAIKYDKSQAILFDSNQKKIRFINKTVIDLSISNVKGIDIRVEDAGRSDNYREKFDLVFTRAMSDIYIIAELAAPLLKTEGTAFLYVNKNQINLNKYLYDHISEIGLSLEIMTDDEDISNSDKINGILLKKIKKTDDKFPRKMPVIKRMAMKCI